jgi:hypothetical protein
LGERDVMLPNGTAAIAASTAMEQFTPPSSILTRNSDESPWSTSKLPAHIVLDRNSMATEELQANTAT